MIKILRNSFEQFIGVMFKKLKQDDIYLFIFKKPLRNFYIHTFFCKQPLDIYLLNENWIVVDKMTMKPYLFHINTLPITVKFMIETTQFSLEALKYEVGSEFMINDFPELREYFLEVSNNLRL